MLQGDVICFLVKCLGVSVMMMSFEMVTIENGFNIACWVLYAM
jgi:hypothetical protein